MSKKECHLYTKRKKIFINEKVYKSFCKSIENEKYIRKLDKKNKLILFQN